MPGRPFPTPQSPCGDSSPFMGVLTTLNRASPEKDRCPQCGRWGSDSKKSAASICGGRRSSMESAAASGCRHCRPAAGKLRWGLGEREANAEPPPDGRGGEADMSFPGIPGKPQNSGSPIYASRIRRLNRRQQVAVGTADRQQPAVGTADRARPFARDGRPRRSARA